MEYEGTHSVTFILGNSSLVEDQGLRNSWDDWFLIPSSAPEIPLSAPTLKYIEVPGRSGSLDATFYLVNELVYPDRTGSFEFIIDHEKYGKKNAHKDRIENRDYLKEKINSFFTHSNRKLRIRLEDDPDYLYYGRCYLRDMKFGTNYSTVSIEYRVDPWKYGKLAGEVINFEEKVLG